MLKFGVLGAAAITPRALIFPCVDEPRAQIRVIAARDRERAQAMADWAGIRHVVDDYQAVIDHPDCNAIYIPLPITAHREWTLKALAAGKPVLCEKSMAANAAEARDMADAADAANLVLMEAFHYRYHSVFLRAKEILAAGELGPLSEIEAVFNIQGPPPETDIRMLYAQGGGATMDLGCYPLSWCRHLLEAEPEVINATAIEGPPDVDLMLRAELVFPDGVTAVASSDMRAGTHFDMHFTVHGARGTLRVEQPLVPQIGHSIEVTIDGETRREVCDRRATYGYQLDAFIDAVDGGAALATDGADAVRQMTLIDRCYTAAGMRLRGG
ncbi:MAG: Gfo/Idh/MocA family oxidoreductase [Pseudomonadota bacterium]